MAKRKRPKGGYPAERAKRTAKEAAQERKEAMQRVTDSIKTNVAFGLQRAITRFKGLTKPKLAAELGLPTMNVYRAFDGSAEASLTTLVILARRLRLNVNNLVGGVRYTQPRKSRAKAKQ